MPFEERTETAAGGTDRTPAQPTDNPHDKGYKSVLKNRRVLLHMLRKYTDFKWVWKIHEEDIEFEDKEFITEQFRTYESDLICRIRHEGQEIYLFLLMELQSGMDFTMPFRLLVYMVNMWEQYFRNVPEEVRERKDFQLPVVVPMVLYNGKDSWTARRRFRDYLQDGDSFGEYGVNFQYALIDVRRLAEDLILNTNTVIDNIFYLDRAKGKEDFLRAVEEMMDRVAKLPADEKNLMEIWFAHVLEGRFDEKEQEFIRQCFRKGEKKMISGFEQIVIEERENAKKEGLEQGLRQGIEQGRELGRKQGIEQGRELGRVQGASREKERGIQILLETCRELGQTMETAVEKLVQKYALPAEEARELAEQYFKN